MSTASLAPHEPPYVALADGPDPLDGAYCADERAIHNQSGRVAFGHSRSEQADGHSSVAADVLPLDRRGDRVVGSHRLGGETGELMTSLLERVLEANGAARFASVSKITATVEYGGTFWDVKGHPSFVGSAIVEASAHEQWIRQIDVVSGRQMIFDRSLNQVTVMERNGEVIEELHNPRRTFGGYTQRSPWSVGQMAYFRCYTTWHYLVEPFVFAFPGTTSGEIAEHAEHGEHWRGLCVTFPAEVDSHNQTQLYYFDDAYHLRRTDLQPEVNDYSPTTQYVHDQIEIDGITLPTKRLVHLRRLDRSPDTTRTPLTADLSDIQFR